MRHSYWKGRNSSWEYAASVQGSDTFNHLTPDLSVFGFRCGQCKMTINIMCKYIIAAILLCNTVGVMSAANACSPPIANCSCVDGTLSCMHLTELPTVIPSNITEFMFEECRLGQLTHIPYTKAEVLFIRNSGLTDISDGVLQNLVSLKTLDLTGNRLVSLRKEMFLGLRSLTDLSLRYSGIKQVADDAFENLLNLIEINLSDNSGLQISDNVLSKNKELKHIMLRQCDLKNIPINALSKAQALTTLELEHNPLGSIPTNTFTKLNKLQKLNLFGCSLTAIPVGTFNGLKSLVTLNLGENNITEIPDSVFDDSRTTLQNLYLNDNKLKSLTGDESGDDIISWQNLHELKLGGNPWTCDCNLKWMRALDKSRIDDGKIMYVSFLPRVT